MSSFKDLSEKQKNVNPDLLLCNWPDCKSLYGDKKSAERLCPSCLCVGYCCIYCMEKDWDRHIRNECQKNICLKCTK